MKSIERYTGISRGRARNALDRLKEAKLIEEQKGAARYGASAYYLVEPEKVGDEEPERICLPNAIVTGAEDETPPIELLRASPSVLRHFIDLYNNAAAHAKPAGPAPITTVRVSAMIVCLPDMSCGGRTPFSGNAHRMRVQSSGIHGASERRILR